MHAGDDIRKVKCLEGLTISFSLVDYNHRGLHETCSLILKDQENIISALSKCWSIIDEVHRIREISQAIPGLSNRNENLAAFLEQTRVVEKCRHYIQHLRGELSSQPPHPYPVWGSLSWVDIDDEKKSYTALMGAHTEGVGCAGSVYDNKKQKWVSSVTLGVKNNSVNFDPLYRSTMEFKEFILGWLMETYRPGVSLSLKFPILSASIAPSDLLGCSTS